MTFGQRIIDRLKAFADRLERKEPIAGTRVERVVDCDHVVSYKHTPLTDVFAERNTDNK